MLPLARAETGRGPAGRSSSPSARSRSATPGWSAYEIHVPHRSPRTTPASRRTRKVRDGRVGQVIAGGDVAGADLAVGGEVTDDRQVGRIGQGVEEDGVRVSRLRHGAMISSDLSPPDVDAWPWSRGRVLRSIGRRSWSGQGIRQRPTGTAGPGASQATTSIPDRSRGLCTPRSRGSGAPARSRSAARSSRSCRSAHHNQVIGQT